MPHPCPKQEITGVSCHKLLPKLPLGQHILPAQFMRYIHPKQSSHVIKQLFKDLESSLVHHTVFL